MKGKELLILFDGYCRLCNRSVRFLIRHDKEKVFRYLPLQSDEGQRILKKRNISSVDSVVLINGDSVNTHSEAFIVMLQFLPIPWKWLKIIKYIPKSWRDFAYNIIAKNRFHWFGRLDSCEIRE